MEHELVLLTQVIVREKIEEAFDLISIAQKA